MRPHTPIWISKRRPFRMTHVIRQGVQLDILICLHIRRRHFWSFPLSESARILAHRLLEKQWNWNSKWWSIAWSGFLLYWNIKWDNAYCKQMRIPIDHASEVAPSLYWKISSDTRLLENANECSKQDNTPIGNTWTFLQTLCGWRPQAPSPKVRPLPLFPYWTWNEIPSVHMIQSTHTPYSNAILNGRSFVNILKKSPYGWGEWAPRDSAKDRSPPSSCPVDKWFV